jgi:hypothetical protein
MIPELEQQRHRQRAAVYVVLLMFNLTLIILQIWLFTGALENLIAGKFAVAIPAAIVSLICAGVNVWMLVGLYRMEKRT